jgi:hypothetical protein
MARHLGCLRTLILVVTSLIESQARADGTAPPSTPELNSLTTPDSPAFVILGVSPTTIQRPTTPQAVATSLASAFSSNGQTLVPNYALEVAPYWIWSHPRTTFADVARNSFTTPLEWLTVSIATTSSGAQSSTSTTSTAPATSSTGAPKAAFGVRTNLVNGGVDDAAVKKMCDDPLSEQAKSAGAAVSQSAQQWINGLNSQLVTDWNNGWSAGRVAASPQAPSASPVPPQTPITVTVAPPADASGIADAQRQWTAQWNSVWNQGWTAGWQSVSNSPAPVVPSSSPAAPPLPTDTLSGWTTAAASKAPTVDGKACLKAATARLGFVWDAAGALALSFSSGQVDQGRVATYSLWTTASWLTNNFSGLVLMRFMQDNLDKSDQHTTSLDLGARAIVAVTKFGISVEGVYRVPLTSNTAKDQYRIDLAGDVELHDGLWFSVTGGHDFIDGSDWSKFFALANFKGNFGSGPNVTPGGTPASGAASIAHSNRYARSDLGERTASQY